VLARELNALPLAGVRFREAWFTPTFSKFVGLRCGGCQIHVTDRDVFQPVATTLAILQSIRRLHGAKLELHDDYFDKVLGTSSVRAALAGGDSYEEIVRTLAPDVAAFAQQREPFLLYP
jgi:uncharacterized protein YbbC (DUF1343 family)